MELHGTSRKLSLLSVTVVWLLSGVVAELQPPQEVTQGQMVLLRASYSQPAGADLGTNTVVWNYVSNNTQLIISYTKGSMTVGSSQFRGRVGFKDKMPSSDVSLYINNTREADSGRYMCQVIIPNNPGFTADLILDVKVPPAVPKCSVSGKAVLKGNVTLSCTSSSGKPLPEYKWRKTSPTNEVFFSPMANIRTGTLQLTNLSRNMSGKYLCTASNTAGQESCSINLDIVSSTNVGKIVGATVGSVVGFIIILLVCLFFVMKRRGYSEDDMANEIKEDAQAPKRVSWAKSGMGSDLISKNGTLSSMGSSPHHHNHLQQYPQRPPSDTASIITATGSMAGYRPSPSAQYGYSSSRQPVWSEASSLPRPERHTPLPQAYSQTPPPPPLPTSTVTASNIARMGGVPIMVPAQNQAGSLV